MTLTEAAKMEFADYAVMFGTTPEKLEAAIFKVACRTGSFVVDKADIVAELKRTE